MKINAFEFIISYFYCKLITIKKLISIFVLFIFLGNYLGITIFFQFERKAIKQNAEIIRVQNIDNVIIELSLADYYNALEEEGEIVINGNFFDISGSKIIGNRIILIGHYDENETKLIEWFNGFPNKKAIQYNIYNYLNSLFIEKNISFSFMFFEYFAQKYFYLSLPTNTQNFSFYLPPKI